MYFTPKKGKNRSDATKFVAQEKIREECQIKGSGWFGFQVGKTRPRRIRMDNLELGWTAWKFTWSSQIFWYNALTDVFQEVRPVRREQGRTRKCPGCDYEMELTYPSQFCSRSCMYENV
jgi:hypothetical protein